MRRLFVIIIITFFSTAYSQDNEKKTAKNIPAGYENVSWGSKLSAVKDKIKGKLYYTDDKNVIISKDGDIEYHYGFFYVDPAVDSAEKGKGTESETAEDEGKLFYVAIKFPYLTLEEVKKKIEDKYGKSTNENIHDNQGAIAWNGEKTIVIMWVDRYEDKPYCRRITYVSKEIVKELNEYQQRVFNKTELDIIKKLAP